MKRLMFAGAVVALGFALLATAGAAAGPSADWSLIGPDGGNVRSLAYDPE